MTPLTQSWGLSSHYHSICVQHGVWLWWICNLNVSSGFYWMDFSGVLSHALQSALHTYRIPVIFPCVCVFICVDEEFHSQSFMWHRIWSLYCGHLWAERKGFPCQKGLRLSHTLTEKLIISALLFFCLFVWFLIATHLWRFVRSVWCWTGTQTRKYLDCIIWLVQHSSWFVSRLFVTDSISLLWFAEIAAFPLLTKPCG